MQASWDRYVGLVTHFLLFALTGIQYLVLMTVMLDIERMEKKIDIIESAQAEAHGEMLVRLRSIEAYIDQHVGVMNERLRGE